MLVCQSFTKLHSFLRIHQVDISVRITRTTSNFRSMIIRDDRFSHTSFLGSYNNYTICCTCTIKGCCRSILQYINSFNILRINSGNCITYNIQIIRVVQIIRIYIHRISHYNTIQYPQRFSVSQQCRSTTYTQTRSSSDFS